VLRLALAAALGLGVVAPVAEAAAPRADLSETAIKINLTTVAPSGHLKLKDTVRNSGKAGAGRTSTGYYLSKDRKKNKGDILLGRRSVKKLKRGKSSKGSKTVKVPAKTKAGKYYVLACADSRGKLKEKRERNNCLAASKRVTISAPASKPGGGGSTPTPAPAAAPAAPTGVTATPDKANHITLNWNASPGATSYRVLRGANSGGPYTQVAAPTGTAFQDSGLADASTYYYVVQAVNSQGASARSSQVSGLACFDSGADDTPASATTVGPFNMPGTSQAAIDGTLCRGDVDWYKLDVDESDFSTGPTAGKSLKFDWTFDVGTTVPGSAGALSLQFWQKAPADHTGNPGADTAAAADSQNSVFGNFFWGESDGGAGTTTPDDGTYVIKVMGNSGPGSANTYSLNLSEPSDSG
jgi:hypothetical protein